jgi:hypothetical protein
VEAAAGVDAVGSHLEYPDGAAAHAVAAPAEDHGVDPPWQDPPQQHLSLFLVEQPTHDEVHQAADDCIRISPTKQRNRS